VILYVYIDDLFAYKSRVYPKSSNPVLNLDIDILIPEDARKLVIELYDAQDSDNSVGQDDDHNVTDRSDFDDDDKIFYTKIGKTELLIDKILSNLLDNEEYQSTRNIVAVEDGAADTLGHDNDDIFSNHSLRTL